MNVSVLRLSLFVGILTVMFLWETWRPKRQWLEPRSRRWSYHVSVSILNTLLTRALFLVPILWWIEIVRTNHWGMAAFLSLTGVWEIILTVIVFDLFDYWWHRMNHRIPFLWRFHKYHHYDTQVDASTALRFQPGELFLSYLFKAVWILVWGPSLTAFVIFEVLITFYAIFHHSNIDFRDSFENILRLVHMTPRIHASHHTVTLRTRNANYSTIFLIWDRIFGTFRQPDFQEMKDIGIDEGKESHLTWAAYVKAPLGPMR